MKISRKTGEITGKLVASTKSAPNKTGSWFKTMSTEISEGYRSVVPKVEKPEETTAE